MVAKKTKAKKTTVRKPAKPKSQPKAEVTAKPEVISPADPLSKERLLGQMLSLAGLPSDELTQIIDRQIDTTLAAANAVSIDNLRKMLEEGTSMNEKVGRSMILRNVSNLMDGMSRQRLVLAKVREVSPGRLPHKNTMLIPPELNDEDWEKKYAGTFSFGRPSKAN